MSQCRAARLWGFRVFFQGWGFRVSRSGVLKLFQRFGSLGFWVEGS